MYINCETNKDIDSAPYAERELKPCPFCGCDMKIESVTIDYIETALLVGSPRHKDGCMIGAMASPRSKDIDKLVEFWNRRADNG